MNLDEAQRKKVADWVAQGLKLSDIQSRISSELGITMTYMDVRFLVDDLKLVPKDIEPPKTAVIGAAQPASAPPPPAARGPQPGAAAAAPGDLSVTVDQLARPGTVVSGKVTFSDGNRAEWYFDQTGRLGLIPEKPGYRPPPSDLQKFQMTLESELSRMGL